MQEVDSKKQKEVEWIRQHTLTQEQTKQLILNKFNRAMKFHLAKTKQSTLFQNQS